MLEVYGVVGIMLFLVSLVTAITLTLVAHESVEYSSKMGINIERAMSHYDVRRAKRAWLGVVSVPLWPIVAVIGLGWCLIKLGQRIKWLIQYDLETQ